MQRTRTDFAAGNLTTVAVVHQQRHRPHSGRGSGEHDVATTTPQQGFVNGRASVDQKATPRSRLVAEATRAHDFARAFQFAFDGVRMELGSATTWRRVRFRTRARSERRQERQGRSRQQRTQGRRAAVMEEHHSVEVREVTETSKLDRLVERRGMQIAPQTTPSIVRSTQFVCTSRGQFIIELIIELIPMPIIESRRRSRMRCRMVPMASSIASRASPRSSARRRRRAGMARASPT